MSNPLLKFASKIGLTEEVPDKEPAPAPIGIPVPFAAGSATPTIPTTGTLTFSGPASDTDKIKTLNEAAKTRLGNAISATVPPNYSEFCDMVSTLAETIPDEASRFRTAIKLFAKKGHPVPAILGDIDSCVGVLEAKNRDFSDELKAQVDKKVGSLETENQRLEQHVGEVNNHIRALQDSIKADTEKFNSNAASIAASKQEIAQVQTSFTNAFQWWKSELQKQRQQIENYGKGL